MTTLTFIEKVDLREPAEHGNECTRFYSIDPLASVEERVHAALPAFRDAVAKVRVSGIVAALVDRHGRLANVASRAFGEDAVTTLVVGRHSHCDLRAEVKELSLRHVAVVCSAAEPSYAKVFDLRSQATTASQHGHVLDAAVVALPCALQLGGSLLMLAAAGSTIAKLRTGFAPIVAEGEGTPFLFRLEDFAVRPSAPLTFRPAPLIVGSELGREPTSEITCTGVLERVREHWFRPRLSELARGVLVGRYARCEAPAGGDEWNGTLSRVHALLFATESGTYVCDLGSTFGVRHADKGLTRLKHLRAGDVFTLGEVRLSVVEAYS